MPTLNSNKAVHQLLLFALLLGGTAPALSQNNTIFSLPLEELIKLKIFGAGSLTPVKFKKTPAAITRITEKQVLQSGARNMLELLDIYVPGVQWIRHFWEFDHLGARGITSDREDKIMIRVNGHVMNDHSAMGAISERDFPMMTDIHYIDVVRGAGSSLHGLGAVSMVIDIHTHDARSKDNNALTLRVGAEYQFSSLEGHVSKQFENGNGLYFYAATADINGADQQQAPLIIGTNLTSTEGVDVTRGEHVEFNIPADGAQHRDLPPTKLHLQFTTDDGDYWLRYTRAGKTSPMHPAFWTDTAFPFTTPVSQMELSAGYQQLTLNLKNTFTLSETFNVEASLGFDSTDIEKTFPDFIPDNHRNDEWSAHLLAHWQTNDQNVLAYGVEYSNETFGLKSPGYGTEEPFSIKLIPMESWSTQTWSLVGEWQTQLHSDLVFFLGSRADKNTDTKLLFSPRASLVYSPNDKNTLKFLATRSQRMNFAIENRVQALTSSDEAEVERLDSLELIYEFSDKTLRYASNLYFIDLDVLGWDQLETKTVNIGRQSQWGFELEIGREWQNSSITFSHGYTKLLEFELKGSQTLITPAPFGYGNKLADWSDHITKLVATWSPLESLQLNTSLRYYRGFPGSQEYKDYYVDQGSTIVDEQWEKAFDKQVFLNLGANWQANSSTSLSLYFYNLLGLANKDLNKRLYRDSEGIYRVEAPAVALSIAIEW